MNHRGPIPPLPPVSAPPEVLATARLNCAARLCERGYPGEAAAFEQGERDFAWPSARPQVLRRLDRVRAF